METKKRENVEFLTKQVFYTGFGDISEKEMVEAIISGKKEYQLTTEKMFGKDKVTAELNFRKADSGMDFFNSYDLTVKEDGKPDKKQNFRVETGNTFTFHEGYNLMKDRFIFRKFTRRPKKDEANAQADQPNGAANDEKKERATYYAWAYLDPVDKDKNGNLKVVKLNTLNPQELKALVLEYPIKGKDNEVQLDRLVSSLQRGNRAYTMFEGEKDVPRYIEVDARNRSLKVYDENQEIMLLSQKTVKAKDQGNEQKPGQSVSDPGDSSTAKAEKKSNRQRKGQAV